MRVVDTVVLLSLAICRAAEPELHASNKGLISHGERYDQEAYPYVVCLVSREYTRKGLCTGTLISPLFVLTAAHCAYEKRSSSIRVYRGAPTPTSERRRVHRILVHEEYRADTVEYDISLLKSPFDSLTFVTLSGQPSDFAGDKQLNCVVIGFGLTETGEIPEGGEGRMTNVSVNFGPHACKPSSSMSMSSWQQFLCLEPDPHMTCSGDSGGPMICNGHQYGVCSHMYKYRDQWKDFGCGTTDVQVRHIFVYAFRDWISYTMLNTGGNPVSLLARNFDWILCAYAFLYYCAE